MNRHIFLFLTSLWLVVFTGCRKDEQRPVIQPVNVVSITPADSTFTVTQLDTLKLVPSLTESLPGTHTYSYEWKLYPQASSQTGGVTVLSTERNLSAVIEVSPGNYYLQYTVTDKGTGVAGLRQYPVVVKGAFDEGWLVASTKNGKALLSMIRTDDEVFFTPAEEVNQTTYPGKALSVQACINYYTNLIILFTDKGAYRFNATDFLQNGSTQDIFSAAMSFTGKPAYNSNKLVTDQYVINDGGVYAGMGGLFYPTEVLKPMSERFTGDYYLYPVILSSAQTVTYFYDNKYKRFMQSGYGEREIIAATATTTAAYNMASVGKTMIGADYGIKSYSADEFYMVMEDNAGRYLYSLSGSTPGIAQAIGNSPDILTATSFATSSVVKHLYYASGNKIYLYDILANTSRLVYTFSAGSVIGDLKMLRSTSKRLAVAVNNGGAGEVYYLDLDNLGNVSGNTYSKHFTGFGEIVQLTYRNVPSL